MLQQARWLHKKAEDATMKGRYKVIRRGTKKIRNVIRTKMRNSIFFSGSNAQASRSCRDIADSPERHYQARYTRTCIIIISYYYTWLYIILYIIFKVKKFSCGRKSLNESDLAPIGRRLNNPLSCRRNSTPKRSCCWSNIRRGLTPLRGDLMLLALSPC